MNRRVFISGTVAVLAAQLAAEAQQPGKVYRIGLLDYSAPDPARQAWWNAFRQRVRERGYVDGPERAKRAELPVEPPTKFELVINLPRP